MGTIAGFIASIAVPGDGGFANRGCSSFPRGRAWLSHPSDCSEAGRSRSAKKNSSRRANIYLTRQGDDADFAVGSDRSLWSDYFAREKDRLLLHCDEAKIDNRSYGNTVLHFHYDRVAAENDVVALDQVAQISGIVRELQIPREAMGRGDLKFLAAIGAFRWRAVLKCFCWIASRRHRLLRCWSGNESGHETATGPYLGRAANLRPIFAGISDFESVVARRRRLF